MKHVYLAHVSIVHARGGSWQPINTVTSRSSRLQQQQHTLSQSYSQQPESSDPCTVIHFLVA